MKHLPDELILEIGMRAGFHACIQLMRTCKSMFRLFNHPSAWHDYSRLSTDLVTCKVVISTVLHPYDHLIFGTWPWIGQDAIYMEHNTLLEHLDFLGGISFDMDRLGHLSIHFFNHRETLDCYHRHVVEQIELGQLAPSLQGIGGIRVAHSCPECDHYDQRRTLSSQLVLKSLNGWGYTHLFPDKKRCLEIKIKKVETLNGMPLIQTTRSINGKALDIVEQSIWNAL